MLRYFLLCLIIKSSVSQFVCDTPYVRVDTDKTRFEFVNCSSNGVFAGLDGNGTLRNETFTFLSGPLYEVDPNGNIVKNITEVLYSIISSIPPENFPPPPVDIPPGTVFSASQMTRTDVRTKTGRVVRLLFNTFDFIYVYWDICDDIVECNVPIGDYIVTIAPGIGKISIVQSWPFASTENAVVSETLLFGSNQLVDCTLVPLDDRGDKYEVKIIGTESVYTSIITGYLSLLDGNFTKQYYNVDLIKVPINSTEANYDHTTSIEESESTNKECGKKPAPKVPKYSYCVIRTTTSYYNYSVLFDPSIAVLVSGDLGNGDGNGCGSSSYYLNSPMLITSGVAVGVCLVLVLIIILLSELPPCARIIKGTEAYRISRVRKTQLKYRKLCPSSSPSLSGSIPDNFTDSADSGSESKAAPVELVL